MNGSKTVVGIDIAKRVFQLHWIESETGEIVSLQIKREKFLEHFANRQPCLIGMEACGGAQHWARKLTALGHQVRLLPGKAVNRPLKNPARLGGSIKPIIANPDPKTEMRGSPNNQSAMFSYVSLEERIPKRHPLRRVLVDTVLAAMDKEFEAAYAKTGRPSVPPECLLKAMLLQILFAIRSERLLVEGIDYNLPYRWFAGLAIDDPVRGRSTFSQNRARLFNEGLARVFFEQVKALADRKRLTSSERFGVDGALVDAWASHKSFRPKHDDGPSGAGRNPEVDFKGQTRSNDTHASTTDPDARLHKKSQGTASRLCRMSHVLMENRNGLAVPSRARRWARTRAMTRPTSWPAAASRG